MTKHLALLIFTWWYPTVTQILISHTKLHIQKKENLKAFHSCFILYPSHILCPSLIWQSCCQQRFLWERGHTVLFKTNYVKWKSQLPASGWAEERENLNSSDFSIFIYLQSFYSLFYFSPISFKYRWTLGRLAVSWESKGAKNLKLERKGHPTCKHYISGYRYL